MSHRRAQLIFTGALSLPLIFAVLTAPPFVSRPTAQVANRFLGSSFPVRVDTSGDGNPTESSADSNILPTVSGSSATISTPWSTCAPVRSSNSAFTLSNQDTAGRWQRIGRTDHFGRTQRITITSFTGGLPTGFSLEQVTSSGALSGNGTGSLQDTNGDGTFDRVTGTGTQGKGAAFNFTVDTALSDITGDGFGDYISIAAWATQASSIGVVFTDSCTVAGSGGTDPQVWIPLADSDGDNRPDSIVLDLNGNSVADPEFFRSPRLVPPTATPTMSAPGLVSLLIALVGLGLWSIRRRPSMA